MVFHKRTPTQDQDNYGPHGHEQPSTPPEPSTPVAPTQSPAITNNNSTATADTDPEPELPQLALQNQDIEGEVPDWTTFDLGNA